MALARASHFDSYDADADPALDRVTVIDYHMGNLRSVSNALECLKIPYEVTDRADRVRIARRLILPGVGHFAQGMTNLHSLGLLDALKETVSVRQRPILGICLGMQLLADRSEEGGDVPGLGLIEGKIVRLRPRDQRLRVPHFGWSHLTCVGEDSPLLEVTDEPSFYFVHSYHYVGKPEYVTATIDFDGPIAACIEKEHVLGVQFHPEKSQAQGLQILRNFARYQHG